MAQLTPLKINPELDLVLERIVDIPRAKIWAAWTQPELIKKWFTPAPWKTIACEIDLRPGGAFRTTMQSPDGKEFPTAGCYLEVVENQRLIWTDALLPGYRPSEKAMFTAVIALEDHGGGGTKYTAYAIHKTVADRENHEKMGFHTGWGMALDQLVALMKN